MGTAAVPLLAAGAGVAFSQRIAKRQFKKVAETHERTLSRLQERKSPELTEEDAELRAARRREDEINRLKRKRGRASTIIAKPTAQSIIDRQALG